MLHMTAGLLNVAPRRSIAAPRIPEHTPVAHTNVSAPMRHSSRFSHIIRGGTVVGILASASGGILCQIAALPYGPMQQTLFAAVGILAGAVLGAREPA